MRLWKSEAGRAASAEWIGAWVAASVAVATGIACGAEAEGITFRSAQRQAALLELYTSEGCSSCPPAESWVSHQKKSPALWRDFVPVAFHVDYWDHLGWRDPWASRRFSDRQRAYARRWQRPTVYTPGFVLNGREWRGWEGGGPVAVEKANVVGTLTASSSDRAQWQLQFAPPKPGDRYDAHAALLASGLVSDVKAGENRGRRLDHDFVVVELVDAPLAARGEIYRGECSFERRQDLGKARLALAVWVTRNGGLEPVQALGGWMDRVPARQTLGAQ